MSSNETQYRIYAGGNIVHQDDFHEHDHAQPYYDDYQEVTIPDALIDLIAGPAPIAGISYKRNPVPGPESVELDNGKYTYINDNGRQSALRHGEEWPAQNLVGNGFVYSMGQKIFELQEHLNQAERENIVLRKGLTDLATNELSSANSSSIEIAARRVRNVASEALANASTDNDTQDETSSHGPR